MENKKTAIVKAIICVMNEVASIKKNSNVGVGSSSYKGVSDADVKVAIGRSMAKNGLVMIPIDIKPKVTIERWEETYNGVPKQKQQVFTEVESKYLLLHESGESIEVCGYGHGVDTQDKASGKATTYALKYALLYTFLVPTGDIDDADAVHSNSHDVPSKKTSKESIASPLVYLTDEQFQIAMKSSKKAIIAVLAAYNGKNGKAMTSEQNIALSKQLSLAPSEEKTEATNENI